MINCNFGIYADIHPARAGCARQDDGAFASIEFLEVGCDSGWYAKQGRTSVLHMVVDTQTKRINRLEIANPITSYQDGHECHYDGCNTPIDVSVLTRH